MTFLSSRRVLSRSKMLDFLVTLAASPAASEARTLFLPSGLSLAEAESSLKEISLPPDISPGLLNLAVGSKTGSAVFISPGHVCLVLPPFPVTALSPTDGFFVEPLVSLLHRDYRIALVLVRLGAYAIGVCSGESLVASKVGTGLVHGRHRQGGSSAHRFERHRDKQIEYFLTRVCQHARERLQPYAGTLDYVVYGGAWTTILSLQKQCPFLGQFNGRLLPPLLDIPDPRQPVLETAVGRIWSSTLVVWSEEAK